MSAGTHESGARGFNSTCDSALMTANTGMGWTQQHAREEELDSADMLELNSRSRLKSPTHLEVLDRHHHCIAQAVQLLLRNGVAQARQRVQEQAGSLHAHMMRYCLLHRRRVRSAGVRCLASWHKEVQAAEA